ncbi:hypothetical protein M231_01046 [Tremella mesenterica]|uniref:Uncharacterized protein n=1 Tax=Tremella mesenterica TaxID=5217 RepID=A0A4V1M4U1_TREME|nr:hypothetical protein M231_01046 [Tremella mesenterica]
MTSRARRFSRRIMTSLKTRKASSSEYNTTEASMSDTPAQSAVFDPTQSQEVGWSLGGGELTDDPPYFRKPMSDCSSNSAPSPPPSKRVPEPDGFDSLDQTLMTPNDLHFQKKARDLMSKVRTQIMETRAQEGSLNTDLPESLTLLESITDVGIDILTSGLFLKLEDLFDQASDQELQRLQNIAPAFSPEEVEIHMPAESDNMINACGLKVQDVVEFLNGYFSFSQSAIAWVPMDAAIAYKLANPSESLRKVAGRFEVSHVTLHDRLNNKHAPPGTLIPRNLSIIQEEALIANINEYAARGTLLTPKHVGVFAQALCDHRLGVASKFYCVQEVARLRADTPENRIAFLTLAKETFDAGQYHPENVVGLREARPVTPPPQTVPPTEPITPTTTTSLSALDRAIRRGEITPGKTSRKTRSGLEQLVAEKALHEKDEALWKASEQLDRAARGSKKRQRYPHGERFDQAYQESHAEELAERRETETAKREGRKHAAQSAKDTHTSKSGKECSAGPSRSV